MNSRRNMNWDMGPRNWFPIPLSGNNLKVELQRERLRAGLEFTLQRVGRAEGNEVPSPIWNFPATAFFASPAGKSPPANSPATAH